MSHLLEEEINIIKRDLGIEDHDVDIYLVYKRVVERVGDQQAHGVHRGFGKHTSVKAGTRFPYRDVLRILMHELRHAKQKGTSGWLVIAGNRWVWTGDTQYAPGKATYGLRSRYWTRPHEVDARGYEGEVDRLFPPDGWTDRAIPTPQEMLAEMLRGAL